MFNKSQQNARLTFDGRKRPVIHILRFDEGTQALRSLPVIVPENPTTDGQAEFRWVLQNRDGEVVFDSQTGKPVYQYVDRPCQLPVLMMSLGFIEEPETMLLMRDVVARTGRARETIKRDVKAGRITRTYRGPGRSGFLKKDVDAYIVWLRSGQSVPKREAAE